MKRSPRNDSAIYGAVVVVLCLYSAVLVHADSWGPPRPFERYSANSNFVARVNPSSKSLPAMVEVYSANPATRSKLWGCDLVTTRAPLDIRLTDDGLYVITLDNWGGAGYGPNVLGFYGSNGFTRSYSLFAITGIDADKVSIFSESGQPSKSTMSVWWRDKSFDLIERNPEGWIYAIWLEWKKSWYAWDVGSGKALQPSTNQVNAWYARARDEALQRIRDGHVGAPIWTRRDGSYHLLAYLSRREDRRLFEELLKSPRFETGMSSSSSGFGSAEIYTYEAHSDDRRIADQVLSHWAQSSASDISIIVQDYSVLGSVSGLIRLPSVFLQTNGSIRIWLSPFRNGDKTPTSDSVEAYLEINGRLPRSNFGPPPQLEYRFEIGGINPGSYWVQAVWDKATPFGEAGTNKITPSPGDFVGQYATPIQIKPKAIWKILIDCKTPVEASAK